MHKTTVRRLTLCAFFAMLAVFGAAFNGCVGTPPNVATLEFASQDIENGELPIRKDGSALVGVIARGPDGREVEIGAGEFTWSSSDPASVEVKALGTAALITGKIDWFDSVPEGGDPAAAFEPHAVLTVTYHAGRDDEVSASIPVAVVLNAAGTWRASIAGLGDQVLTLDQRGRRVSYGGTAGDASGAISGDQFTLSQQGFMLTGTFTSRTEVNGTYSGPGGVSGTWTAVRE
ncbi:MAG: hypothetical protein RL272_771 [Candidatus Parcubacteria bacterium]|jgi:hypothetical protein